MGKTYRNDPKKLFWDKRWAEREVREFDPDSEAMTRPRYAIWANKYYREALKTLTSIKYAMRDCKYRTWKRLLKANNKRLHRQMERQALINIINQVVDEEEALFTPYKRVDDPWAWD